MRTVCVLVLLLLVSSDTMAQGTSSQASQSKPAMADVVQQAGALYDDGRLPEAEHIALKALDQPEGLTKLEKAELYKLLAFCSIANDDEENAIRHFISALNNNPNIYPDPIAWSPKVRQVFEQAKRQFAVTLMEVAQRRTSIEAEISRKAALRSLVVPGSGQIYKDQTLKGLIAGGLFWVSLGVFIYAESEYSSARDEYRQATGDFNKKYDRYRNYSRLAIASGSLALISWNYSFFDALFARPSGNLAYP